MMRCDAYRAAVRVREKCTRSDDREWRDNASDWRHSPRYRSAVRCVSRSDDN